jgi:excisionase family DNA binding protein
MEEAMLNPNQPDAQFEALLTRAEVARMLSVSPTTVTRWAREHRLPCRTTLGGHRRYSSTVIREIQVQMSRELPNPS